MSKKILKRSLALGALMAFVITGQAWASLNGDLSEIKNFDGAQATNGNNVSGKDLTFESNIDLTDASSFSNITLNVNNGTVATFNGDTFNVDANYTKISGSSAKETYAMTILHNGTIVDFGAKQVNIGLEAKDTAQWASGLYVNTGAKVNFTDTVEDVSISAISNGDKTWTTAALAVRGVGSTVEFKNTGDVAIYAESSSVTGIDLIYANVDSNNPKLVFDNEGDVTVTTKITPTDSQGAINSIGIQGDKDAYLEVTNSVDTFKIKQEGLGIDADGTGYSSGTAAIRETGNFGVVINSQKFIIDSKTAELANASGEVHGIILYDNAKLNVGENTISEITVENGSGTAYGLKSESTEEVNFLGDTTIGVEASGNAHGVYGEAGGTIDLADSTITATSKDGRAYGVYGASGAEIDLTDTTINATSKGEYTYGIFAHGESDIDVTGTSTIVTTLNDGAIQNAQAAGVQIENSSISFDKDVTLITEANNTANLVYAYGARIVSDVNGASTAVFNGNLNIKATSTGEAYGLYASGSNDTYADVLKGEKVVITVDGDVEVAGICASNNGTINASEDTSVIVKANSKNKTRGLYTLSISDGYGNINLEGNVNIEATGNGEVYSILNQGGNIAVGGAEKEVILVGDVAAQLTGGKVEATFGTPNSKFDGKVETVGNANTTLNFNAGAWNLKGASTVSDVTFAAGSVLNLVDADAYKAKIGKDGKAILGADAGTYAITAAGTETNLTVDGGAKLQITDIEETTYNIAAGFAGYENVAEKIDIADNALLQAEKIVSDGTNGAKYYQVEVKAKEADQMAADTGISESTAGLVETIIQNANSDAAKVDGSPEQAAVEFIQNVMNENGSDNAAVGNAINAATKMGEAGGNSATAASIVKNVTGVTNDRLSFNCGHSAPHKGGHGVGLFEEGSGADIWVEYVHGKDEVEDMPSSAGATSYEGQYNGIVMGVDFKKVNKFQSGIAFNYGEGDTNSLGSSVRTHSDYDFWGVGYYGNIHNDDSNVIFDINYAKTDSDVTQYNSGSTLEASPETTTWSAGVKLEKLYQNENVQIVPYTGLRYMSIDADDYSTKKGEFYYSMERQDIWLLPVGVSIRQEVANDNGWTVSPRVDLSYIWAFGDTNSNMEVKSPFPGVSQIGYDVMDDGSFLGLVGIEAHKGQWGYGVAYSYQKGDHSESKKWFIDANYSF